MGEMFLPVISSFFPYFTDLDPASEVLNPLDDESSMEKTSSAGC